MADHAEYTKDEYLRRICGEQKEIMITGAFVRIERDGKWQNIEINQLTDDELKSFSKKYPDAGWRWAIFLAKWVRDNVKEK